MHKVVDNIKLNQRWACNYKWRQELQQSNLYPQPKRLQPLNFVPSPSPPQHLQLVPTNRMPPQKEAGEAKGRKAKERQEAGEGGKVRDCDITMWT